MDAEYKALLNKYRWYFAPHIACGIMYWVFVFVVWLPSITDRHFYEMVIIISVLGTLFAALITAQLWEFNPGAQQYRNMKREHEKKVLDKYYSTNTSTSSSSKKS